MENVTERLSDILNIVKNITWSDCIDIACVSVLIYFLYKFIKERRAGKLAIGVLLLFLVEIVSTIFDMYVLQFLLQNIFQVGLITLVILFQPEIRSVLEKVGATPLKSIKSIGEGKDTAAVGKMIEEVVSAVSDFAQSKTGALIVIERTTRLGEVIATGTKLDAYPAAFLIKNIFYNKAPLHDGAMVIRDNRIYAAGCLLPLSNNPDIIQDLGTRHRAGIGISEISDALVIIVSEETGIISTVREGKMVRNYSKKSLASFLRGNLLGNEDARKKFNLINRVKPKNSANGEEEK